MISLKESWRVQRKQRQYEVLQRQQQVHKILEQFQQARQVKAAELREDLRLFQLELQLDTQEFLSQVNSQRQLQAEQLLRQLHCFTQALHQQTAQLIAINAADRTAKAEQLTQSLSEFHADLSLAVTLLRQDLQQQMQVLRVEVQTICAEAQELLQDFQQERIQNRTQQIQTLAAWIDVLHTEVQDYLAELSLLRHDRAHQLQTMLQDDRDRRTEEISEFFQQLAQFRSELKAYCADLHQAVWGSTVSDTAVEQSIPNSKVEPSVTVTPQAQNSSKATPQSNGQQHSKAVKQPARRPAAAKHPTAPQSSKPKTQPSRAGTAAAPSAAQPVAAHASPSHKETPMQAAALPQSPTDVVEQRVYTHLQQTQGARLTDIETTLEINRFQAVDALRSLIKKGLVTQRDRMYLIQEDINL